MRTVALADCSIEKYGKQFYKFISKSHKTEILCLQITRMMLQCACCQRLVLLLRTINLEQANGNYEEQIDQMQGISEYYDTIICSEKVCNYSLLFTL